MRTHRRKRKRGRAKGRRESGVNNCIIHQREEDTADRLREGLRKRRKRRKERLPAVTLTSS